MRVIHLAALRSAALAALLATAAVTFTRPAHAGGQGGGETTDEDGGPPVVESMTPDPSACAVSAPGDVAVDASGIALALLVGASLALRRRR
jgi:hypothetical protein